MTPTISSLLLDGNVEVVAKHGPTLLDETFKFKMALTLRRKQLVAFVLLELFEDGNDGLIQTRKNQKMVKRTCRKEYVHCKVN